MSNQQPQADKRTASQRIDDLERGLIGMYQTADNMARDLMTMKEALKLLGNKLDAVVKANNRGNPASQITDEVISAIMLENNVEELKEKVTKLVQQGILVPSEEVIASSFLVGKEIDDQGKVVNPRLQFTLSSLQSEDLRKKILGAKPGQLLTLEEGKLKLQLDEVYNLQMPKAPEQSSGNDSSGQAQPQ